jgi:predicted CXXCH cytochrome family protein
MKSWKTAVIKYLFEGRVSVLMRPGLALTGVVCLVWISCVTPTSVFRMPPDIPNAEFMGSKDCLSCHETHFTSFETTAHAEIPAHQEDLDSIGCEVCHGPGSIHSESGGAYDTIINPKEISFRVLSLSCRHAGPVSSSSPSRISENGQVNCSDCHDPHHGTAKTGNLNFLTRHEDASCLNCHPGQRGPFVFEHEAMREGCTICHDPHGSINAKMLKERNSVLCLKCHAQELNSDLRIGGLPHRFLMREGTCWTAGCHEAVHGSHVSSSLRY